MKRILISVGLILFSLQSFAQKQLPEGWDEIILEGKTAYMNLITGDVTTTFPKRAAVKAKKVQEYDPTKIHTVKKGETLSKIARKYNMSLGELIRLNSMENFDSIEVGQQIVVGYEAGMKEERNEKYEDTSGKYHIVKSGETLYRIAKNYGLSVSKLKQLNNLKGNKIAVGQELVVAE